MAKSDILSRRFDALPIITRQHVSMLVHAHLYTRLRAYEFNDADKSFLPFRSERNFLNDLKTFIRSEGTSHADAAGASIISAIEAERHHEDRRSRAS
jgi:hypothetical protein